MVFRVLLVYVMNVITSSKGVNKMGKRGMLNLAVNFIMVIAIMVSVLAFDKDNQRYFAKTTYDYDIDTSDMYVVPRVSEPIAVPEPTPTIAESETKQSEPEIVEIVGEIKQNVTYGQNWSEKDKEQLAKIAMAEAEGCDLKTKVLVILVILNRVQSQNFPDSISEVIFEKSGNVYQFSPCIPGGRYYTTSPNSDCYEAVEIVANMDKESDYSQGALYFECCKNPDNWHSRNLEYLYQRGGMRFYK